MPPWLGSLQLSNGFVTSICTSVRVHTFTPLLHTGCVCVLCVSTGYCTLARNRPLSPPKPTESQSKEYIVFTVLVFPKATGSCYRRSNEKDEASASCVLVCLAEWYCFLGINRISCHFVSLLDNHGRSGDVHNSPVRGLLALGGSC